ncbi:hypothetical protein RV11_GL001147 [Enterococcus phoeniculicola]|jgi:cytochrome bd-type quinol oxidase subunit 1|uniref:Uncharacterized protein n=1 Tax=Enterococcus phoeniculicola ATCC BAA-412 TaxID=1158610 RepID=R3WF87_9ENTE|nr:hypothetical protein [Enterococcus phoeniculicola]EOL46127.1 hypothetical protein UC3_00933 [Enterococcus phoeniculicola ATCC BAA-412]EOT77028.1 hypothetical protein I589_01989 [Enterococcus phoeniculicola ATCC BAA-412]OJG73367.1 hypothetical protein RV11_GL001147 [Enterococcus phoeniculicola]
MTPEILTYLLAIGSFTIIAGQAYRYQKNKKNGHGIVIRPVQLIAAAIVLVIAFYAIFTGQTYEDLVQLIERSF